MMADGRDGTVGATSSHTALGDDHVGRDGTVGATPSHTALGDDDVGRDGTVGATPSHTALGDAVVVVDATKTATGCMDNLLPLYTAKPMPGKGKILEGILSDYCRDESPRIPGIVIHCVNQIEARGMHEVGIYRISGSAKEVKNLKEKFFKGKKALPNLSKISDINVISGCLKDFLRGLKEPLVTFNLWKNFVKAAENCDKTIEESDMYQALIELPRANKDTIAFLMRHLLRVSRTPECKMPVNNLSRVFGPTMIGHSCPEPEPMQLLNETKYQAMVMDRLFEVPVDYWINFSSDVAENIHLDANTPELTRGRCMDNLLPLYTAKPMPGKGKILEGILSDYCRDESPRIPGIVIHCVNQIEARGLHEVGIYRVSGSAKEVKNLKEKFFKGKKALPNLSKISDINVISGCLKDFLRGLKEPLVTFNLWKNFVKAAENSDKTRAESDMYQALIELPRANKDTIAFLMRHLLRVSRTPECKMPVNNLSRVFGPTMIGHSCPEPEPMQLLNETKYQAMVMDRLFEVPVDYWINFSSDVAENIHPDTNTLCTPELTRGRTMEKSEARKSKEETKERSMETEEKEKNGSEERPNKKLMSELGKKLKQRKALYEKEQKIKRKNEDRLRKENKKKEIKEKADQKKAKKEMEKNVRKEKADNEKEAKIKEQKDEKVRKEATKKEKAEIIVNLQETEEKEKNGSEERPNEKVEQKLMSELGKTLKQRKALNEKEQKIKRKNEDRLRKENKKKEITEKEDQKKEKKEMVKKAKKEKVDNEKEQKIKGKEEENVRKEAAKTEKAENIVNLQEKEEKEKNGSEERPNKKFMSELGKQLKQRKALNEKEQKIKRKNEDRLKKENKKKEIKEKEDQKKAKKEMEKIVRKEKADNEKEAKIKEQKDEKVRKEAAKKEKAEKNIVN